MFNKILIANRGEIAVRIIRACKEMNIKTVAVYSEADKEALHVMLADEAICIGPAKAKDSYLNMQNIISAAVLSGATAIHPGFGFLSENSTFAHMCEDCNITFIGPRAETIELLGNKAKARETMKKAKVPIIPGSSKPIDTAKEAKQLAKAYGYPIMIKACSGGGGRGMRAVFSEDDLENAYDSARSEAKAAFGDDSVYIEKLILHPKHIEVQVLADRNHHAVHLFERDCSMQRRNQKVLEEAPSLRISGELREKMGNAAVLACEASGYEGVGTIEFLLDKDGSFYFMEMNTRIQVEHPVTEMITGIDLVKEQIKVASGLPLSFEQKDIKLTGHAIECRINAEDPEHDFRPSPGKIEYLLFPGGMGVRIDSAVYPGYLVPPCYDSMIAKLIVHASTREEAILRMKRALDELVIEGIITNTEFQYHLISTEQFLSGEYHTGFIEGEYCE